MSKSKIIVWFCVAGLGLGLLIYNTGFARGAQSERRAIKATGNLAKLPFSNGMVVGNTLYVAGHIGIDPKTGMAATDINQEIKLLLDGIAGTLNEGGMTMDDLVSVQVYCTDLSLYEKFNAAYAAQFKKDFPARMFVGAGSLLRNGHFEMMGIAVKR